MKLCTFQSAGSPRRLGVVSTDESAVVPIDTLVRDARLSPNAQHALEQRGIEPADGGMLRWLQLGAEGREQLAPRIRELRDSRVLALPMQAQTLRAPLARPGKIVGVGRNYADHATETGVAPFEKPRIIFKVSSCVADPGAMVAAPPSVVKFDFEAELAVVIGDFAHAVDEADALSYVAGYTALNDMSAREFQFDVSPPQTTFAKSMDGFCPLGPWLVSAEDIPDPQALDVRCRVNGEPMQDANTSQMLFPVRTLIAYVSGFMTLEPGDVIATGTPAGIGAFRKPPRWLRPGDTVEVDVQRIGILRTGVVRAVGTRDAQSIWPMSKA